jgi:hypothetical protein
MLKDIIEERKKEVQSDPWLTPMFDPTISEEEKRIAINTIIEQTAQIVAREVLEKVREQLNTFEVYDDEADNCRRFKSEALFHLQSLEEELTK